ncbi:30S ribosomal protein S1 [Caldanaerobius polysaccharolyticus]|uniref:30S ribosomal protein S1 n=1 Tax=Caldanaerobius polysaccharolyticus TaxID=44256 RepID=UPI001FE1DDDF|nr:30S ribosomal protein S1 [Caldanaerobius polysaccharolyticus]
MDEYEKTFKEIKRGDVVEGTVIQVNDEGAVLNIGYKADAFVPKSELSYDLDKSPTEIVKVGDKFEVEILKVENEDGNVLASKKRVDSVKFWDQLKQDYESHSTVNAKVYKVVKGGVLADIKGFSCFIPASHLDLRHVDNLEEFLGKTVEIKIIEIDEQKRRIVGSRRDYLKEVAQERKAKALESLQVGQTVKGVVRNLTDYGAFIDVGGIDGLLRVSEISWGRIKHPSDVLKVGDKVDVYVLSVDKEKEKIALSIKRTLPDPWDKAGEKYHVGDIKSGKVVAVNQFGAFVELEPGIDGLIYRTYLKGRDDLKEGDVVKVEIVNIDLNKKRIRLALSEF